MVKSLQKELQSTKQQQQQQQQQQEQSSRSQTPPPPSTGSHSQHHRHRTFSSRQDSINEEESTNDTEKDTKQQHNVSSLIENFEKRQESRLKRSSTLPYRVSYIPTEILSSLYRFISMLILKARVISNYADSLNSKFMLSSILFNRTSRPRMMYFFYQYPISFLKSLRRRNQMELNNTVF